MTWVGVGGHERLRQETLGLVRKQWYIAKFQVAKEK
jgi:hypothetical protein